MLKLDNFYDCNDIGLSIINYIVCNLLFKYTSPWETTFFDWLVLISEKGYNRILR